MFFALECLVNIVPLNPAYGYARVDSRGACGPLPKFSEISPIKFIQSKFQIQTEAERAMQRELLPRISSRLVPDHPVAAQVLAEA